MTPTTYQLKDLLAKASAAPWEAYNQPGDWGMMGAWYVNQAGQNPSIPLAMVEYETPYCLGASNRSIDEAMRARSNATLIALAPTLAAEVVRLREYSDRLRKALVEVQRSGSLSESKVSAIKTLTE